MDYRYTDGTPVFPGDKAAWRDVAGVVVFSRGAGFEGLLLKTAAEILPVSESELKWQQQAVEPHYLTGEEMREGDVVELDTGDAAYPTRLHLFRARSRFEFWEPGEVLFLQLTRLDGGDAPLYFPYTDENGYISEALQEIRFLRRAGN